MSKRALVPAHDFHTGEEMGQKGLRAVSKHWGAWPGGGVGIRKVPLEEVLFESQLRRNEVKRVLKGISSSGQPMQRPSGRKHCAGKMQLPVSLQHRSDGGWW